MSYPANSSSGGERAGARTGAGALLIDPANWFVLAEGPLSPAGVFSTTLPLTGISPAFLHTPVYLQGAAFDPGGFWRLSNSTVAVVRP